MSERARAGLASARARGNSPTQIADAEPPAAKPHASRLIVVQCRPASRRTLRNRSSARSPSADIRRRRRDLRAGDHGCSRASRPVCVSKSPLLQLQFEHLLADEPLERRDPCFVFLDHVGGGRHPRRTRRPSYFWTQTRIRLCETSWRFARPCSVSPPRYSCTT